VEDTKLHPRLGVRLPSTVTAFRWDCFAQALEGGVDLLILGVSSAGIGWAIDRIAEVLRSALPVLMITKGLVSRDFSIEVLPRIVARECQTRTGLRLPVMAVGGPCIAGELAAMRDTNVVMAGDDREALDRAIDLLETPYYRVRASTDVVGVEACAAFKNLYAIGVGSAIGRLERAGPAPNGALMHNLAASLFAQSLSELSIVVGYLGGEQASVAGLAGAGDLYVTCQAGRNCRMGRLLGLGLTYSRAKADYMPADTIEGAELALTIGPTLETMMMTRALPGERMPLTRAIVGAICRDQSFHDPWEAYRVSSRERL
jgi:glycerol-3-phosphate dehydrogenase (NAD(P)+)